MLTIDINRRATEIVIYSLGWNQHDTQKQSQKKHLEKYGKVRFKNVSWFWLVI
jgi:hypothetical protein